MERVQSFQGSQNATLHLGEILRFARLATRTAVATTEQNFAAAIRIEV